MIHDVPTGKTLDLFLHEDAVYGVSGHPVTSSVFATACADGRATLFDVRMSHPDQEGALNLASSIPGDPFLSIQFNPSDERVVLVARLGIFSPFSLILKDQGFQHSLDNLIHGPIASFAAMTRTWAPPFTTLGQSSGPC